MTTGHVFPPGGGAAASRDYVTTSLDARDINAPRPASHNLIAWAQDPINTAASAALTLGTLYLTRVSFRHAALITSAWFVCPTSAGAPTTVEVSLFTADGVRRALSANVASSFTTTGAKKIDFAAPYTPADPVNFVWVGILAVGGTTFNLTRCTSTSSSVLNLNLAAASSRFATAGTGLSATPASFTPANLVQPATANDNWWTGLS